ncbi:MAG: DUF5666 domain-containing protein [Burkholderiaceae bacterium]
MLVLGRNVDVQPTTFFADDLAGGLAALAAGDVVEVYGLYNAVTDRFIATRVERKSSPSTYRIRGKISGLNSVARTFSIGPLQVSYASISPGDVPADFVNGAIIRVRLNPAPGAGGLWTVNRLRDGVSRPDDGLHSKVKGLISGLSAAGFSVGGVAVTTSSSTTIVPPSGVLGDGIRVEVEGTFSNGALAATQIEIESDSDEQVDLRGAIQTFSASTQTFTIQGLTVSYSMDTQFDGGDVSALRAGANVRVRAVLVNGTQFRATRIEFK